VGLRIGELARRTGVGVSTLRAWETRYRFPRPERTASGHRVYSEGDVDLIAGVLRLVADGFTLPSAISRASARGPDAPPEEVIHDVTEEVDEGIRHAVQARLLDSISEAVAASRPDGSLLYVNAAAERVFGWRRSDVVGRDGLRLMPAPDDIREANRIHQRLMSGKKYNGQLKLVRFDGRSFTAMLRSAPVFGEDGELLALTAVITDRSAHDRLNRSKRKLELQMEVLSVLGSRAAHLARVGPAEPERVTELTTEIVNSVQRLLGADQAYVLECPTDGAMRCTISPPRSTEGVFDAPWYQPMLDYMELAERAVRIDDVQNDTRVDPASLPPDCPTHAAIGARVARRNGVRTVLVADSRAVARFDPTDEFFVQSAANLLTAILDQTAT
jgi:PAS domain S-box-containing protein